MPETAANPYVTDRPIGRGMAFYGREAEFDWVTQSCLRGERVLILHGASRIGKTSFLFQLSRKLPPDYVVAYVDLASINAESVPVFVWQAARSIVRALTDGRHAALPEPHLDLMRFQAGDVLGDMLAEAQRQLNGRRLIVALDSVEALLAGEEHDDKLWTLIAALTSRLSETERVHVLFSGENADELHGAKPPRIPDAAIRRLGSLSMNAATSLVIEPARDFISFEPPAVRRIIELTSSHPYYIQMICGAIWSESGESAWTVSVGDVERVADRMLSGSMQEFEDVWESSTSSERIVLTGLGMMRGNHGIATRQEVGNALRRERVNITQEEVTDNLECLVARGVLERLGALTYRFRVELLRVWLRRRKTIDETLERLGQERRSEELAARTLRHIAVAAFGMVVLVIGALVIWWPRSAAQEAPTGELPGTPIASVVAVAPVPSGPTPTSTPHPTPTRPRVRMRSLPTIAYFDRDTNKDFWQIWVMGSDGKDPVRVSHTESHETGAAWSPDGKQFVLVSERDGNREIYVMNADGSNPVRLTKHPADDWMPVWAPDGKEIAFVSRRNGNWEIFTIKPDGSDLLRLTETDSNNWTPAYSPDGQEIVFASNRDGDWEIYVMNRDGSEPMRLTSVVGNDFSPAWSPRGNMIVFESSRDGDAEVYVMNKDGSNPVNLSRAPSADDHWPCWSPDGSHVAFQSNRDGDWDIFVVTTEGTNLTNLTKNRPGSQQGPSWRP